MEWNLLFQGIIVLGVLLGGLWFVLGLRISPLEKSIKRIEETLAPIHNFLMKKFQDYKPLSEARSQKKITDRGREILEKHNINPFLEERCLLLNKDSLKKKEDPQIFMESWKWVEEHGKEKIFEILLNSNDSKESIKELLALFIMEKVKKPDSNE